MNTANSPKNGLPKELNNIPLGQVFVLTNPYLGITPGDILTMQFIFSMARQYGQYHIVNTMPVEYSGLWNCRICKVQTMQGVQLLVADNGSLVEMLCEFWGLDYDTVRKDIKLPTRYNARLVPDSLKLLFLLSLHPLYRVLYPCSLPYSTIYKFRKFKHFTKFQLAMFSF